MTNADQHELLPPDGLIIPRGKLIGVVGYAGSGKTDLTRAAIERWDGPAKTIKIGFSDPIIDMMRALGVPQDVIDNKARWSESLPILQGHTLRHATTTLGTQWGRNLIGDRLWTQIALKRANEHRERGRHVIIDNCRFPSEFEALRLEGAAMIALYRDASEPHPNDRLHQSETYISMLRTHCDFDVLNNGTFDAGVNNVRLLLHEIIAN